MYANTTPFYTRDLSICRFWCLRASSPPGVRRHNRIHVDCHRNQDPDQLHHPQHHHLQSHCPLTQAPGKIDLISNIIVLLFIECHINKSHSNRTSKLFSRMAIPFYFLFIFYFLLFRAAPEVYGVSQARSQIKATATGLDHSHSNTGSKPHLRPTP